MSDLSKAELRRIADEFKSERDAAKEDAMRAFDERNNALDRLKYAELRARDLLACLREYIAAADESMRGEDDVAAMLRFGAADRAARKGIKQADAEGWAAVIPEDRQR